MSNWNAIGRGKGNICEIMAENFPNWIGETNSLVKEAQRKHKQRTPPKNIIVKLPEAKHKGKS